MKLTNKKFNLILTLGIIAVISFTILNDKLNSKSSFTHNKITEISNWLTYIDEELGYKLKFPKNFYSLNRQVINHPQYVTSAKHFANEKVGSPSELSNNGVWITIEVIARPNNITTERDALIFKYNSNEFYEQNVAPVSQLTNKFYIYQVESPDDDQKSKELIAAKVFDKSLVFISIVSKDSQTIGNTKNIFFEMISTFSI